MERGGRGGEDGWSEKRRFGQGENGGDRGLVWRVLKFVQDYAKKAAK